MVLLNAFYTQLRAIYCLSSQFGNTGLNPIVLPSLIVKIVQLLVKPLGHLKISPHVSGKVK